MTDALVDLLFPNVVAKTPDDYAALYPRRSLPKGAMVTRIAPSPTGYMHIGGIYVSLINQRLAAQTNGVFFLRIEDTDTKRQVEGALETIVEAFARYDIHLDEGVVALEGGKPVERGAYGPYIQSARVEIYRDYAISMLRRGLAYPCFSTAEEIDEIRQRQLKENVKPGIHGRWSKWRTASIDEVREALAAGKPFVVRLRAPDDTSGRVEWKDGVKGEMSMPVNDLDIVILKTDGIPTYHFAHAIDDHLMGTTHVIRGDEWISSMPTHLQLFRMLGFPLPAYAHVPPIQKIERIEETDEKTGATRIVDSRRKLSKRKDEEANIDYYREIGVPERATVDYLLNIANSSFEDWRKKNPRASITEFPLRLDKLAAGGALSDLVKLKSISKDVISFMNAHEVYTLGLAWAERFDAPLAALMRRDPAYTERALGIERDSPKGNKRIVTWPDLRVQLTYFFDELYDTVETFDFPEQPGPDERKVLLAALAAAYDPADSNEVWLQKIRDVAVAHGYAAEPKQFKAEPQRFKGHFGDVAMLERVAICGTRQSPDLHTVLSILGPDRVRARFARFV